MKKTLLRWIIGGAAALAALGACFSGCGSTPPVGAGGTSGGDGGSVTVKLDGSVVSHGGNSGTSGPPPTGDANCGSKSSTKAAPVDVLLVLDRSGSMSESIAEDCCCVDNCSASARVCSGTTCTERWPALTSAVSATLTAAATINWGLKLFATAGKSSCAVSNNVEVEIGSANAVASIQASISGTKPGSNTPTRAAVTTATTYLQGLQSKDANTKVILLATDGEPNCNPSGGSTSSPDVDGTKAAIAAAAAAGFKVYVIGIGPSVGNLDSFAQAGGTNKSYPTTSADELANALKSISQAVVSCTFTMDKDAPDPNNVAVYLDTNLIAKDAANGWSWAPNSTTTVVLNGKACNDLTSGAAKTVHVLFGCPGQDPPPVLLP